MFARRKGGTWVCHVQARLTKQAVHMTLPVPEQKGQVSSPPFLAVAWAAATGTLPLPAQLPHVR